MYPFIVGDIGGTNARFAVVHNYFDAQRVFEISDRQVLTCADFDALGSCLHTYVDSLTNPVNIKSACIAVAGPITGDTVKMTNLPWEFSIEATRRQFDWQQLKILNDFAAQACAVPYLHQQDLVAIKPGEALSGAVKAIIGPGTGLGVALLAPIGNAWYPLSGEGGHVALAPTTEVEVQVVALLLKQLGYVSLETVLCGPGLRNLYRALCTIHDHPAQELSPADISQLGCEYRDDMCTKTLDIFCSLLGNSAGNLALTSGSRGGVYLAGGILPLMTDFLKNSDFNRQFANKGLMSAFVEAIPVHLITADQPALIGAAAWQLNHGHNP